MVLSLCNIRSKCCCDFIVTIVKFVIWVSFKFQATDLGSPAEVRRSSSASHEPQSRGPSSSSHP